MVALAAHLAQVRDLPVLQALDIGLGAIQQARDARRRKQGVVLRLQGSELLATHVRAAARHHHGGIPAKQRQRSAKRVESLELLLQLFVRRG